MQKVLGFILAHAEDQETRRAHQGARKWAVQWSSKRIWSGSRRKLGIEVNWGSAWPRSVTNSHIMQGRVLNPAILFDFLGRLTDAALSIWHV